MAGSAFARFVARGAVAHPAVSAPVRGALLGLALAAVGASAPALAEQTRDGLRGPPAGVAVAVRPADFARAPALPADAVRPLPSTIGAAPHDNSSRRGEDGTATLEREHAIYEANQMMPKF